MNLKVPIGRSSRQSFVVKSQSQRSIFRSSLWYLEWNRAMLKATSITLILIISNMFNDCCKHRVPVLKHVWWYCYNGHLVPIFYELTLTNDTMRSLHMHMCQTSVGGKILFTIDQNVARIMDRAQELPRLNFDTPRTHISYRFTYPFTYRFTYRFRCRSE